MDKNQSRRNLIRFIPAGLFFLWAARGSDVILAAGQQNSPANAPPPPPSPFGKDGQLIEPVGILGPAGKPTGPPPAPRKDLTADDKDIRKQVALLALYADELKKEVERTDSTKVLSVQMLRKTQSIEKLARHIVTLAAG